MNEFLSSPISPYTGGLGYTYDDFVFVFKLMPVSEMFSDNAADNSGPV